MMEIIRYCVYWAASIILAVFMVNAARAQTEPCTPGYCNPGLDTDQWVDAWDNCLMVNNNDQRDTDHDGVGNACDADFNQSGLVTATDYTILRNALGTDDPNVDVDGSGLVTVLDYTIVRDWLGRQPGPAAVMYETQGGDVYNTVVCLHAPPDYLACDPNAFDEILNLPYLTGSVVAGQKCWRLPPQPVPTGVPNTIWGLISLEGGPGPLAVCHVL